MTESWLQGLVTTLHEGDDFGQLALVNDAPRAATIILRENNCHFLRVDKHDFNRIIKVPQGGGREVVVVRTWWEIRAEALASERICKDTWDLAGSGHPQFGVREQGLARGRD